MAQLALFDSNGRIDHEADSWRTQPSLYVGMSRGLTARTTEFGDWARRHGQFGCIPRSHAWHPGATDPATATDHCLATVMSADLRCTCYPRGMCVGALVYRGACCGCDWEGAIRASREHGVIDALDHACPGWHADPDVPAPPRSDSARARAKWTTGVTALLGERRPGWPIRTRRTGNGSAPVAGRSPWGGYDLDARTPP